MLRQRCIEGLGAAQFAEAYRYLKALQDADDMAYGYEMGGESYDGVAGQDSEETADAKLAVVSQEMDEQKQIINQLETQQQQINEHTAAKAVIAKLQPQQQALSHQLAYHQNQRAFIDNALAGKLAWGHQHQATVEQTRVIHPTLKHIILITLVGSILGFVIIQLIFRALDRTLDHGMKQE